MENKRNLIFSAPMDDELLDLMLEQVVEGKRGDRGFKYDAYVAAATTMTQNSNGAYVITVSSVKNRCKYFKKQFAGVTEVLKASGFGFDNITKRVVAIEDQLVTGII